MVTAYRGRGGPMLRHITGLACRLPAASNMGELWRCISRGSRSSFTAELPCDPSHAWPSCPKTEHHLLKATTHVPGALFHGTGPVSHALLPIACEVVYEALLDAGYNPAALAAETLVLAIASSGCFDHAAAQSLASSLGLEYNAVIPPIFSCSLQALLYSRDYIAAGSAPLAIVLAINSAAFAEHAPSADAVLATVITRPTAARQHYARVLMTAAPCEQCEYTVCADLEDRAELVRNAGVGDSLLSSCPDMQSLSRHVGYLGAATGLLGILAGGLAALRSPKSAKPVLIASLSTSAISYITLAPCSSDPTEGLSGVLGLPLHLLASHTLSGSNQMVRLANSDDPRTLSILGGASQAPYTSHPFRAYKVSGQPVASVNPGRLRPVLPTPNPPVWLVFCGMGSQWPGMAETLFGVTPCSDALQRCADALAPYNVDLIKIMTTDTLYHSSANAFAAITAISIAQCELLRRLQISIAGIIGHSVGEIAAAYADNCLTLTEAMTAAYELGRVLQAASGSMAAVGLTPAEVRERSPILSVAAENSPSITTVAGDTDLIAHIVRQCREQGKIGSMLRTCGVAFHTPAAAALRSAMIEALAPILARPRPRSQRWISTSSNDPNCSAEYFAANLSSCVRFSEAVTKIPADAIVVELGPDCALSAPLLELRPGAPSVPLSMRARPGPTAMADAIGRLFCYGTFNSRPDINDSAPVTAPPTAAPLVLPCLAVWDTPSPAPVSVGPSLPDMVVSRQRGQTIYFRTVHVPVTAAAAPAVLAVAIDAGAHHFETNGTKLTNVALGESLPPGDHIVSCVITSSDCGSTVTIRLKKKKLLEASIAAHYYLDSSKPVQLCDDSLLSSTDVDSPCDVSRDSLLDASDSSTKPLWAAPDVHPHMIQGSSALVPWPDESAARVAVLTALVSIALPKGTIRALELPRSGPSDLTLALQPFQGGLVLTGDGVRVEALGGHKRRGSLMTRLGEWVREATAA
eukprot:m.262164 g.262164  ORF g.262164 m.262164 type:complete len:978 (-) comp25317_c0_seq1:112-3045(-)